MSDIIQPEHVCYICKKKTDSSDSNIRKFGDWESSGDMTVHTLCLYFGSTLKQRCKHPDLDLGDTERKIENLIDGDNILGFHVDDIKKLVKECWRRKCKHCKKTCATVECASRRCLHFYHYGCAEEANVHLRFRSRYDAFCPKHNQIEDDGRRPPPNCECLICGELLGQYDKLKIIPDCCNQTWYHRECMQHNAMAQGYLMKCPTCAETDEQRRKHFVETIQDRGIFVPKKDAIWETNHLPNAHYDDNPKPDCDAVVCNCGHGRGFREDSGEREIEPCNYCGSRVIHYGCRTNDTDSPFICQDCNTESQEDLVPMDIRPFGTTSDQNANKSIDRQRYDRKLPAPVQAPSPASSPASSPAPSPAPNTAPNTAPVLTEGRINYYSKWIPLKRKHEEKRWVGLEVEGSRKQTYVLRSNDYEPGPNPITEMDHREIREQESADRIDMFFTAAKNHEKYLEKEKAHCNRIKMFREELGDSS